MRRVSSLGLILVVLPAVVLASKSLSLVPVIVTQSFPDGLTVTAQVDPDTYQLIEVTVEKDDWSASVPDEELSGIELPDLGSMYVHELPLFWSGQPPSDDEKSWRVDIEFGFLDCAPNEEACSCEVAFEFVSTGYKGRKVESPGEIFRNAVGLEENPATTAVHCGT